MNPRDVGHMYRRYDSDQDGRLGFWEFSNALLPVDPRHREDVEQRQSAVPISHETMDLLKRVLRRAIEAEAQAEGLRRKVAAGLKGGARAVFTEVDRHNRGFLQKTDIKTLIDQCNAHVSPLTANQRAHPDSNEMEAVIRRFNKDK